MINSLTATINASGGGKVTDSASLVAQTAGFGSGVLPSKNMTFAYGTGANANAPSSINGNCWYLAQRTLASDTYDHLSLYNSLTDAEGNVLDFTYIRYVLIMIVGANGTLALYVGPQNQSNAWSGSNTPWPGGSGATVYNEFWWTFEITHPFAGYAVSTTSVLEIYNPTADSVTYAIWLIGEQS